ncbi:MAG: chromate efflux transporter [Armatimonadota bacterium]|nr:chromate efflux transporter [Armatimonadota bacterium]MDR7449118.1 chromate efflux transporter [Armatimonadota bacterium]MDR7459196.1 chromate efflux transporter [Armatimonadota bacterium]MDR7480468.1 chromate efflux transporter [Armatimonadota bacterium]MDR7489204.1 chromate efflux transporter [Armatimonadota bacterium]
MAARRSELLAVTALFLRLGFTAFGGPAAHIAMMRDEVVRRRRWLSDQEFLDLLGATNLIPGPNSTEMAIHIGYTRAGWPGLVAGGAAFILPAALIALAMARAYVRYGTTPEATALLYGVKPVIIAIVAHALLGLGRAALRGPLPTVVALITLALFFLGVNELWLLLLAGVSVMLLANRRRLGAVLTGGPGILWAAIAHGGPGWPGVPAALPAAAAASAAGAAPFDPTILFLVFLKIGAVLYGGGYVLLAFLRGDFVERLGWLTDRQLLDAVAVGQFTPGPLFTTATFIGYLLGGLSGAALATAGIFLPGFLFVAASHPFIPRLRRSPWLGALLDGVNAAAVALMAGVTWQLGRAALVDLPAVLLALAAALLLVRTRVNSAWLVAGGGVVGFLLRSPAG